MCIYIWKNTLLYIYIYIYICNVFFLQLIWFNLLFKHSFSYRRITLYLFICAINTHWHTRAQPHTHTHTHTHAHTHAHMHGARCTVQFNSPTSPCVRGVRYGTCSLNISIVKMFPPFLNSNQASHEVRQLGMCFDYEGSAHSLAPFSVMASMSSIRYSWCHLRCRQSPVPLASFISFDTEK